MKRCGIMVMTMFYTYHVAGHGVVGRMGANAVSPVGIISISAAQPITGLARYLTTSHRSTLQHVTQLK